MSAPIPQDFGGTGTDPTFSDPYACYGRNPADWCGDQVHTILVWPPHAAQTAFWLLAVGLLVAIGWYFLRTGFCWKCGRETGLCQHTRYDDDPKGVR